MLELSSDHLAIVRAILAEHVPQAKAWAFGSRVLGTAKKFSDLDIAIEAEDELSIGKAPRHPFHSGGIVLAPARHLLPYSGRSYPDRRFLR